VGYHNYKFFVLMLGYTITLSLYIAITLTAYNKWHAGKVVGLYYTMATVGFALSIGVSFLFWFHVYLLFSNKTTIECGINMASCSTEHPYTMGWRANFMSVMGPDPLYWFLPVRPEAAYKTLESIEQ